MNCIPRILDSEDDFECMTEFFVAMKPGPINNDDIDVMTFAVH